MFLNYFALGVLVAVFLILFYGVIIIHDIPYLLAKKRQHPHQDAIHVAGWVSLFTLHAIWPLLWIWATLYRPERGWGMSEKAEQPDVLQARINQLESELQRMRTQVADQSSLSNKG
ncbi:membrane protein [Serratia grimesii]|uniref:Membrane protein n=1 Tax=Serratia grimesii TaxID=82995 RepID=A0ABR4U7R2_9GAMM|nr:membrane protein [Serratia grimesii]